jgi:hypothetical protein
LGLNPLAVGLSNLGFMAHMGSLCR